MWIGYNGSLWENKAAEDRYLATRRERPLWRRVLSRIVFELGFPVQP